MVYGHKHANKYVYTNMHNAVLLVQGSLRLTPIKDLIAGLVVMDICETSIASVDIY